jgi:hypothetical protein
VSRDRQDDRKGINHQGLRPKMEMQFFNYDFGLMPWRDEINTVGMSFCYVPRVYGVSGSAD